MESFRIDGNSVRDYTIVIEEATDLTPEIVQTLLEIDLQTFAESTYSSFTAAAFLKMGRVFVLRADDVTIGTCVCFRSWERPNEVMLLSMGIRPGWRGRGLGQRFVRGVLERLKSRGIRSVALLVGTDNRRAIKVYGDVGFQIVGERLVEPESGDTLLLMRAVLKEDPHLIAIDAYAKGVPPILGPPPPRSSASEDRFPLPAAASPTSLGPAAAPQSMPSSPDEESGPSSSFDK